MKKWTEIGKDFTDGKQDELAQCFDTAVWHKTPHELSDSAEKAITSFCLHNRIKHANYVADYNDFDSKPSIVPGGYGLLGLQVHYMCGDSVKIYLIDCGTSIRVVCYDITKRDVETIVGA